MNKPVRPSNPEGSNQVKGLYNPSELAIWAGNILTWLQYQAYIRMTLREIDKRQGEYKTKSWWYKLWHGEPSYPPSFFYDNPFTTPSAADLEKFELAYPDMAREWSQ